MQPVWTDDFRERAAQSQDFWLATARPEPAGHVVPIWAVLVGDVFYMGTEETAQKVKNVRAHPRVALALPDTHHPVIFEGSTTLIERPIPAPINEAFKSKYNWNVNGDGGYIVIALTVDKVIAW